MSRFAPVACVALALCAALIGTASARTLSESETGR